MKLLKRVAVEKLRSHTVSLWIQRKHMLGYQERNCMRKSGVAEYVRMVQEVLGQQDSGEMFGRSNRWVRGGMVG